MTLVSLIKSSNLVNMWTVYHVILSPLQIHRYIPVGNTGNLANLLHLVNPSCDILIANMTALWIMHSQNMTALWIMHSQNMTALWIMHSQNMTALWIMYMSTRGPCKICCPVDHVQSVKFFLYNTVHCQTCLPFRMSIFNLEFSQQLAHCITFY